MAQETTGEFPKIPSDDEFAHFFDEVIFDDTARKEEEDAEAESISSFTEKLRSSQVACLSYPDRTLSPAGAALFESGLVDEIADEQSLYAACLQLLRMDNPDDDLFLFVGEGKKQLIEMWMRLSDLSFTSNWVSFLIDTLPGGEVSEADIEDADRFLEETCEVLTETIEEISNLFEDEIQPGSPIDEETIHEKAEQYLEAVRLLINSLTSAVKMTQGELDYQLRQLGVEFAISDATQWKCLEIGAGMFGYDLNELM